MMCDICGVTVGTKDLITVPPVVVVKPSRKGYVPSRVPPSWEPQCKMLGISIASHWKTVVDEYDSVDWSICRTCKAEIDNFEQTGKVRSTQSTKQSNARSRQQLWQCPNCGAILRKERDTLAVIDKIGPVMGTVSCTQCNTGVPTSTVYDGQFDFAESDERIRQMGNDRANMRFDKQTMRWHYKDQVVPLASDVEKSIGRARNRKWWQFWR